jgi:hypothetical protein
MQGKFLTEIKDGFTKQKGWAIFKNGEVLT